MISALLLFKDNQNINSIFSLDTRDNLSDHWVAMKNFFLQNGVDLVLEVNQRKKHNFEIHIDVNDRKNPEVPAFLLVWENKNIYPQNLNVSKLNNYYKIFSHDTETKNFINAEKFFLPVLRSIKVLPNGYANRNKLLVMIANNKSLPTFNNINNLYAERVKSIKWFERNYPNEFYLYGSGWEKSARISSKIGGMIHKLEEKFFFKRFQFNSWKGVLEKKDSVLTTSKFSLVYENIANQNDYITEKIFDSFSFGNVPIYWGAKNILDHIPGDCFIDRRDFISHNNLYKFIKNMSEDEFFQYQKNIEKFLFKEKGKKFSIENFIKSVPNQILLDLKNLGLI